MRNGREAINKGKLLVLGPFGKFEAVATFETNGTELAPVVALNDVERANENHRQGGRRGIGSHSFGFDSSMGKAIEAQAARKSIVNIIKKGGAFALALTSFKALRNLISRFPVAALFNAIITRQSCQSCRSADCAGHL